MNNTKIEPYLFFNGRCEEALNFYKTAVGAEIGMTMRFSESPEAQPPGMIPPDWGSKLMHADFTIGESRLMASDGCPGDSSFGGFSLSFVVKTEADAHRVFNALSAGGEVVMPLTKTFWSPCFGMLKDKFGLSWMIHMVPA
jgi:PhnB protein